MFPEIKDDLHMLYQTISPLTIASVQSLMYGEKNCAARDLDLPSGVAVPRNQIWSSHTNPAHHMVLGRSRRKVKLQSQTGSIQETVEHQEDSSSESMESGIKQGNSRFTKQKQPQDAYTMERDEEELNVFAESIWETVNKEFENIQAFSGPVSSLYLFEKPAEQLTGTRPVGGYFAESVTDLRELQAFVRVFGGYGVDRLDRMMKEHTAALLNCIDTSLRSNHEVLEAVAGSMHSGDRIEREACSRQIVDLDTVIGFCIEGGHALAFGQLLAEAAGVVLDEGAPLNIVGDHDSEWIRSILEDVGGANDGSWTLLPYLFATFMTSNIWNTTGFNVDTGGFNNNIHCLARCMSAVIVGSELVRLEPSIKSAMQLFVKFATGIVLDSWSEANRSNLVAKLIFLDQLCEISPYLPRNSLEAYVRYAILRSIYSQYYSNSPSMPLALPSVSSRHSPAVSLSHTSPAVKQPRGDSTPQHGVNDSGYLKGSSSHSQNHLYDMG
ncbi:hypothetical protein D5086_027453 [Populus alba]|uniref:Uncharacterized protein n=1 Tax=Populus alba TaxID=43335 RepID=A0ACC4AVD6_POPAL